MSIEKIPDRFVNAKKVFTAIDTNNLTIIESLAENTDKINETVGYVNSIEETILNARDDSVDSAHNAKISEDNSKISEDNSKESEINARRSEIIAEQYKISAEQSKDSALISKNSAENSATLAYQYASGTSASVKGVYDTLTDLQNNGNHEFVYVVLADGKWYYFDDTWKAGGVYQGQFVNDNTITNNNLKNYLTSDSENFFNPENVIDKYLVQNNPPSGLAVYNTSILSGFIPIQIGIKYKIQTDRFFIGTFFFVKNGNGLVYEMPICAYTKLTPSRIYGSWSSIDNKVIFENVEPNNSNQHFISFTILPDSEITHILFYLPSANNLNYFGEHTDDDIKNIINNVQLNKFETSELNIGGKNINVNTIKGLNDSLANNYQKGGIDVIKNNNVIQVRCKENPTFNKDIVHMLNLTGSNNGGFTFTGLNKIDKFYPLSINNVGTSIKSVSDDITPIFINGSYMGANHGYLGGYSITVAHDKTLIDIGSTWKDAENVEYILLKVFDELLVFCSTYTGNEYSPLTIKNPVTPLTHVEGASHTNNIGFTTSSLIQIYPAINNYNVEIESDKKIETGNYSVDVFKIKERYVIVSVPAMIGFLTNNIGNNNNNSCADNSINGYCAVSTTYDFLANGNIVVYSNYSILADSNIAVIGGVQSGTIGDMFFVPYSIYNSIDFLPNSAVNVPKSSWNNIDIPPFEVTQLNEADFMTLGYNISFTDTNSDVRKNNLNVAININYPSKKLYPHVADNKIMSANEKISLIGYRGINTYIVDMPMVFTDYKINNKDYLSILIQSDDSISIPNKFRNRYCEVVIKEDTLDIENQFIINDSLNCSGFGHCLLMFN